MRAERRIITVVQTVASGYNRSGRKASVYDGLLWLSVDCCRRGSSENRRGMANSDDLHEERLVITAYDERFKELFKVFAEGLAQGETERSSQDRFLRAMHSVKRAKNLALQAVQIEKSEEGTAGLTDEAAG